MADLQVVLSDERLGTGNGNERIWAHTLMIPAYVAGASAIALVLQAIISRWRRTPNHEQGTGEGDQSRVQAVSQSGFKAHVNALGGRAIFVFRTFQAKCAFALFGLSLATLLKDRRAPVSGPNWLELALCLVHAYASLLGILSITLPPTASRRAARHFTSTMLVTFGVYVYRDVFPLLTFTKVPADQDADALLWAKITVLGVASVVIPLTIPRPYVPLDPKEPAAEPNPEQTASIISMVTYRWLDPIIILANRLPHLPQDKLPPLADYDHAKNLVKRSFPYLDTFSGGSKRHIFWGFLKTFQREYVVLTLMLIIKAITGFLSPLGINKLLQYLESGGKDATIRPWVWISALFWAPMLGSFALQWYIFVATGTMVRLEGIITQLVFEHSLRVRMKAETDDSGSKSGNTTAVATPDTVSVEESHSPQGSESSEGTLRPEVVSPEPSSSAKGKQPVKAGENPTDASEDQKFNEDGSKKADNLVGKISNLVSTDVSNITDGRDFVVLVLYIPLQIAISIWFLNTILGWSAFVGMAVMLALFPIPGYVARLMQTAQVETMKQTDSRVQTVTETMNVLRMIKLFGWEPRTNDRIADKRAEELRWIRRRQLLDLLNNTVNYIIPVATMVVTFATYTVIMRKELKPSTVFSSMAVFDILRDQLSSIFYNLTNIIQAKVSLDRVHEFLRSTELLDSWAAVEKGESAAMSLSASLPVPNAIGFNDATFTWSNQELASGSATPSKRFFRLQAEGEILFKRGVINLIVGPTGSGKTSLLMALLGEMHFVPSGPRSWFSLPREGGIAYAAQESWVQNETIRDNILFGAHYDEARYNQVIYQCGLTRDLTLFEAGDQTEVGEKGLTLSGGQKARVTLARAIYSSAEIILLDDVLAALDVHTARWIVEKCFEGNMVRGRTLLLVTHNVAMTAPIADHVVSVSLDGKVSSRGSVSEALAHDTKLSAEVAEEKEEEAKAEEEVDGEQKQPTEGKKADGKLTVAEEIAEGHVSWAAMKMYFTSMGGSHITLFWIVFLAGVTLVDVFNVVQTWFLGYWAEQYDLRPASDVRISLYLTIYCLLVLVSTSLYLGAFVNFVYGQLRASKSVHRKLIESILGTTLRWLDTTPTSRVITRCTQDIRAVDGNIPQWFRWLVELTTTMMMKFFAVLVFTPIFVIPGILILMLGGWCGQIYIKAQLSVKREMSNAKAPVLGHFGAAINGLTSIRAYGAQKAFQQEAYNRIDRYTRAARTFYNLNRWICIRIDALGGMFAAGLAAYLIYGPGRASALPSDTGFSITMAVGFSGLILYWVRILNEFEVSGNSLERIQGYVTIEQETKPTKEGVPPAYWPASGDLRVENLSARYSATGPKVLHDISFQINSGERVGIVGRTGSGKSSLTLSLLRCIPTEGEVYFDDIPTSSVNLDALRTSITIIPQVPELLSGTLRDNLDPFSQHDDAVLNAALRASGLFSLQSETDEARITLDSKVSSGGGNLSVGQRQILALARALVRGSKLLILDEATSAIDHETDTIIQTSLRRELGGDVTLITVAHRLQTIMDADKIMVLDAGRIVEFGKPSELLTKQDGHLRSLVEESGDKEHLYAMAAGEARSI